MNIDEFRQKLMSYRESVDAEARYLKDTYLTLDKLRALYKSLDTSERALADKVISEWVLLEDEGLRFDALALIDDLSITNAVPALRELSQQLISSDAPGAPYELDKVKRIIEGLLYQQSL